MVLLAWLVFASGICLCLASVPEQLTSNSHDCGTEPAPPDGDKDPDCESGCTAEEAVRAGAEVSDLGDLALAISPVRGQAPAASASETASEQPKPAPHVPSYILHSILLV